MKKTVLNWCSISTDKKLATTQDRQTLQNSDEKQYCQWWILRLVVFARYPANRVCLLKLYMLVKSARTVSRELYWEKRVYNGLTSYVYLGVLRVATILCCCANLSSFCLPSAYGIEQRGPTIFKLRAILQKSDILWATFNKMMYKTTDSQYLKLKRKISECVIEIITQQHIAIYYKSLLVGCLWSRLLLHYPSFVNISVSKSETIVSSSSAIDFCF